MIKCGINLNLNNLQGEITSQLSGFVNLSGSLGSLGMPAGLTQIQSTLGTAVTSIKSKLESLIPEIPTIPQSLRNDLAELVALPAGGTEALAKMAQFVQDYTGLQDIAAFANINLNDLASSVFSVTGTFDPCSPSFEIPSLPDIPNIPNIIKNPLTGALEELPAFAPDLGATINAVMPTIEERVQEVANNFDEATINNVVVSASDKIETTLSTLKTNIQPAISGLGDAVRSLPTGEMVTELKSTLIDRLKSVELRPDLEEGEIVMVEFPVGSGTEVPVTLDPSLTALTPAEARQFIFAIVGTETRHLYNLQDKLRAAALLKYHSN